MAFGCPAGGSHAGKHANGGNRVGEQRPLSITHTHTHTRRAHGPAVWVGVRVRSKGLLLLPLVVRNHGDRGSRVVTAVSRVALRFTRVTGSFSGLDHRVARPVVRCRPRNARTAYTIKYNNNNANNNNNNNNGTIMVISVRHYARLSSLLRTQITSSPPGFCFGNE